MFRGKIKDVDNHNSASERTPRLKLPLYLPYDCFNLLHDWNCAMHKIDKFKEMFDYTVEDVHTQITALDGKTSGAFSKVYEHMYSAWNSAVEKFDTLDGHVKRIFQRLDMHDGSLKQISKNIITLFNITSTNSKDINSNKVEIESLDSRIESAENSVNNLTSSVDPLNNVLLSYAIRHENGLKEFQYSIDTGEDVKTALSDITNIIKTIIPSIFTVPDVYSNAYAYLTGIRKFTIGTTLLNVDAELEGYLINNLVLLNIRLWGGGLTDLYGELKYTVAEYKTELSPEKATYSMLRYSVKKASVADSPRDLITKSVLSLSDNGKINIYMPFTISEDVDNTTHHIYGTLIWLLKKPYYGTLT